MFCSIGVRTLRCFAALRRPAAKPKKPSRAKLKGMLGGINLPGMG